MECVKTPKIQVLNIDEAVANISGVVGGGNVTVAYEDGRVNADYALGLIRRLARAGYIVTERRFFNGCAKDSFGFLAPIEAIRLIIGIGGEEFADTVAACAFARGIRAVFFPDFEYNADKERGVFFCDGMFETKKLKAFDRVLYDSSLNALRPDGAAAKNLGMFFSHAVASFDKIFSELTSKGTLKDGDFKKLIRRIDENGASFAHAEHGASYLAANICHIMRPGLSVGEAAFISSYVLVKLYKKFLECGLCDLAVPKDVSLWTDAMVSHCGSDAVRLLSGLSAPGVGEYLKRRFIVEEYGDELLDLINCLDERLPSLLRRFRRAYPDAGYSLKDAVSGGDILKSIALAAPLCGEYTLAKHMDTAGLFDSYISQKNKKPL